jgi:hypothetical protein
VICFLRAVSLAPQIRSTCVHRSGLRSISRAWLWFSVFAARAWLHSSCSFFCKVHLSLQVLALLRRALASALSCFSPAAVPLSDLLSLVFSMDCAMTSVACSDLRACCRLGPATDLHSIQLPGSQFSYCH